MSTTTQAATPTAPEHEKTNEQPQDAPAQNEQQTDILPDLTMEHDEVTALPAAENPEALAEGEPGNDDTPGEQEADAPVAVDEGYDFQFGDDIIPAATDAPTETAAERQLREEKAALEKQLSDLKAQHTSSDAQPEALEEPDLYGAGIDGDPEKYKVALADYYREQGKQEAQQAQVQQQTQARQQKYLAMMQANARDYETKVAAAKVHFPDISKADDMLAKALPQTHQAALISAGLENPELVAYALYKNTALRDAFMQESDPVRLGVMLADISKKSRLAPRAKKPPVNPEPKVKSSMGTLPQDDFSKAFPDAVIE